MKRVVFILILCILFAFNISAQTKEAEMFDEYGDVCCEYEKKQLDSFSSILEQGNAKGYLIFYGGKNYKPVCNGIKRVKRPQRNYAMERASFNFRYLTETKGWNEKNLFLINGGYREFWTIELWIVPQGAKPPIPTPTINEKDIKFRRGKYKISTFSDSCS